MFGGGAPPPPPPPPRQGNDNDTGGGDDEHGAYRAIGPLCLSSLIGAASPAAPSINDFATGSAARAPATATADGDRQRRPRLSSTTTSSPCNHSSLIGTAFVPAAAFLFKILRGNCCLLPECRPARPAHLDSGCSWFRPMLPPWRHAKRFQSSKAGADNLSLFLSPPLVVCVLSPAPNSGSCRVHTRAGLHFGVSRGRVVVQASPPSN